MTINSGPYVVTDGLIVSTDAENTRCYPGSGTAWINPIGNYSGSLVGSTTFATGPDRFDTNATLVTQAYYLSLSPQIEFADQSAYSFNFWIKLRANAQSTYHSLTGRAATTPWLSLFTNDTTGDSWYIRYRQSGGTYNDYTAITNYNIQNNWANICLTIETNRNVNFYLNGEFKETKTPATTLFYTSLLAGGYSSGGNYYVLQGSMAVAMLYNKTLTNAEVAQNFNALSGRYGI